jgi:hypothetical protein
MSWSRQHQYEKTSLKKTSYLAPALAFAIIILAADASNGQSNPPPLLFVLDNPCTSLLFASPSFQ